MSQEEEGLEENNNDISVKDQAEQEEQQQQDGSKNDQFIEKDGEENPEGYDKAVHVDDLGDAELSEATKQPDNLESLEKEESQIEQNPESDSAEVENMIAKMKGETAGKKKHNCGNNKADDRKSQSSIKEQQQQRKSDVSQNNPDGDNDPKDLDSNQEEDDKIKELLTRLIKMEDNFKQLANEWVNDREDVKNEVEIAKKEQTISILLEKVSEAARNGRDSVEEENISLAKEEALAKALLDRGTGERVIAQKLKENEEKQVKKQQEQIQQNDELAKRIKELEDTVKSLLEEKNTLESNQTQHNEKSMHQSTPNSAKKSAVESSISRKEEFWNPQRELESDEFAHFLPNKPRLNPISQQVMRAPKIYYQTPQSLTREIYRTAVANRQLFMQSIPEEQQNKRNITPLLGSTDKLKQRTQSGLTTPLTKQFSRSEGRNYIIKNHPADKNIFSSNFTPQSQRMSEHAGSNDNARQYSQSGMIKSTDYSAKKKQYQEQTDKLHYLIPDKVEYL